MGDMQLFGWMTYSFFLFAPKFRPFFVISLDFFIQAVVVGQVVVIADVIGCGSCLLAQLWSATSAKYQIHFWAYILHLKTQCVCVCVCVCV